MKENEKKKEEKKTNDIVIVGVEIGNRTVLMPMGEYEAWMEYQKKHPAD